LKVFVLRICQPASQYCFYIAIMLLTAVLSGGTLSAGKPLKWNQLPPLPDSTIGFAGAFSGVAGGAMLVAGGANFPQGLPWETKADGSAPPKIYYRDIWVLPAKDASWKKAEAALPAAAAYGVSLPAPGGLLCIGGERKTYTQDGAVTLELSRDVYLLCYDAVSGKVSVKDKWLAAGDAPSEVLPLPALPLPLTAMAGAIANDVVYIAGGDSGKGATRSFFSLDLKQRKNAEAFKWKSLPAWPGPPRTHCLAAVQHDGNEACFYVFSGRQMNPLKLHTDAYKFTPATGQWKRLQPVTAGGHQRCVMAGTCIADGAGKILLIGGDYGGIFLRLADTIPAAVKAAETRGDHAAVQKLEAEKKKLQASHPGFQSQITAFDTRSEQYSAAGVFPVGSHVTTNAFRWQGGIVIPTGEIRPGVRTRKVWQGR